MKSSPAQTHSIRKTRITSATVNSPLRLGVVGVGHMGTYHINVLSQFNDIVFQGIYDNDKQKTLRMAREYRTKPYHSFATFLKDVDAVILATPTSTHYALAKQILEQKVHILIEKPLTDNIAAAHELFQLGKKQNAKLFVGHVERYNGAVQELSQLVDDKPYCWESKRIGPGSRRVRDSGVGLDLMIHDIDICLRTLKAEIVSQYAIGIFNTTQPNAHEDMLSAQLTFANGCLATFFATRLSHQKERSLTITNHKNTLMLDFTTQDIHLYSLGEAKVTTQPKEIRYQQQSSVQRLFIHKANPLELELRDFIDSIRHDKNVDNTLDLKTLALTLNLVELARENAHLT